MFGEQTDQRGLAQRLDDALYRLESWRPVDRSTALRILGGLAVAALVAGWWYGRTAVAAPVEDTIPVATSDVTDDTQTAEPVTAPAEDTPLSGPQVLDDPSGSAPDGTPSDKAEELVVAEVPLVVHVIGAVLRPGLVTVPVGSRVDDVVAAAGGPTVDAAIDRLNLAAPVSDGMQVRVPTEDDELGWPLMIPALPTAGSGSDPNSPGPAVESGPVNLNTASAEQLDTLPGIGPATAAAILRWREDNGGFYSLEDLLSVPGIGQAKMAAIRDLVTV